MDLSIELAPKNKKGLKIANPVITASGTFGYGMENVEFFDIQRLGAIICKGTTLLPREGNRQPRMLETASGTLNSIGLENIGVKALIKEKAPVWAGWRVPVLVNISGAVIEDYASMAALLEGVPGIAGIEINISCPNVEKGGAEFGARPESAAAVTRAVRAVTTLPVIVKLTPNTGEYINVALAVEEAGADAVSLINGLKGMIIDIERRRPLLGNLAGGLSGPAIKPVGIWMVYQVSKVVKIPVIGMGGIVTTGDAIEFLMAGASAIQVGSASFANPRAPLDILEGIERYMQLHSKEYKTIGEITGIARQ